LKPALTNHLTLNNLSVREEINTLDKYGDSYAGQSNDVGITRSDGSKKTMKFVNGLFVGYTSE
jgi:hypothetical protein